MSDWINVNDHIPQEVDDEYPPEKYLVKVESFGIHIALFYDGRFYKNLAAPFENVTHWMELPKYPQHG